MKESRAGCVGPLRTVERTCTVRFSRLSRAVSLTEASGSFASTKRTVASSMGSRGSAPRAAIWRTSIGASRRVYFSACADSLSCTFWLPLDSLNACFPVFGPFPAGASKGHHFPKACAFRAIATWHPSECIGQARWGLDGGVLTPVTWELRATWVRLRRGFSLRCGSFRRGYGGHRGSGRVLPGRFLHFLPRSASPTHLSRSPLRPRRVLREFARS